jgi:cytochrome c oxidase subunit IV
MNEQSVSRKTLFVTWGSLLVLLVLTRLAASFDLGMGNTIIAVIISGMKMALVILFFMQVRYNSRLVWIFACAGFLWWSIFISLAMTDYLTRQPVTPYSRAGATAVTGSRP